MQNSMATEKNVVETTLYKGKVKVRFFPDTHIYTVDGKRVTGCSTIAGIKDKSIGLVSWALEEAATELLEVIASKKKVSEEDIVRAVYAHERKRDTAAELGTKIHDWIQQYIEHKLKIGAMPEMPEDKNVATGVTNFLEWESNHKVKYTWAEKILYSKRYGFSGRGDFAAKIDGKLCLCDNKSGNALYNSVRLQTAGYVEADEEESGVKYEGRWAIRPAKETESEYYKRLELKNRIRVALGKSPRDFPPYQIFEALYLDAEGHEMERDKSAFIAAFELYKWDKETDFYTAKRNGNGQ